MVTRWFMKSGLYDSAVVAVTFAGVDPSVGRFRCGNLPGRAVGAISAAGPAERMERIFARIAPIVASAAEAISRRLGYAPRQKPEPRERTGPGTRPGTADTEPVRPENYRAAACRGQEHGRGARWHRPAITMARMLSKMSSSVTSGSSSLTCQMCGYSARSTAR